MTPDTVKAALATSKSKHAVLGMASGPVRVVRESVQDSPSVGYLTATLVQSYGNTDPETHVTFDPAVLHYLMH